MGRIGSGIILGFIVGGLASNFGAGPRQVLFLSVLAALLFIVILIDFKVK